MNVFKVYLRSPVDWQNGFRNAVILPTAEVKPNSSCIRFRAPDGSELRPGTSIHIKEVPCVLLLEQPDGIQQISTHLWIPTAEQLKTLVDNKLEIRTKCSRTMELMIGYAEREWKPVVDALYNPKSSYKELLDTWLNHPEVFYQFVSKKRPLSPNSRRNQYIAIWWDEWNRKRLKDRERIAQMHEAGLAEGLTEVNFRKITSNLELYRNY